MQLQGKTSFESSLIVNFVSMTTMANTSSFNTFLPFPTAQLVASSHDYGWLSDYLHEELVKLKGKTELACQHLFFSPVFPLCWGATSHGIPVIIVAPRA
jgi:hypothetical protein